MKLPDIFDQPGVTTGALWFRPVGWVQFAYSIRDGRTEFVPTSRGGQIGITSYVSELAGEWEIVTPDKVLSER